MKFFPLLLLIGFLQACSQPISETSYSCPPTALAYNNLSHRSYDYLYVWPNQFEVNANSYDDNNDGCLNSNELEELETELLQQNQARRLAGAIHSNEQDSRINFAAMWGSAETIEQRIQIHENYNGGTFGFSIDLDYQEDQFLWLGFSKEPQATSIEKEQSWLQISNSDGVTISCQIVQQQIRCVIADSFQPLSFISDLPPNSRDKGYFYFWLCQQDDISQNICTPSEYSAIAVDWHL